MFLSYIRILDESTTFTKKCSFSLMHHQYPPVSDTVHLQWVHAEPKNKKVGYLRLLMSSIHKGLYQGYYMSLFFVNISHIGNTTLTRLSKNSFIYDILCLFTFCPYWSVIRPRHANVARFKLRMAVAGKAVRGKHVVLCSKMQELQNSSKRPHIALLFMLMADIFGWKLSEEMIGIITKLKIPDFVVLISYQAR